MQPKSNCEFFVKFKVENPIDVINEFELKCSILDAKIDSMYTEYNSFSDSKKRSFSGKLYLHRIHRLEEKILKLFKRKEVKLDNLIT